MATLLLPNRVGMCARSGKGTSRKATWFKQHGNLARTKYDPVSFHWPVCMASGCGAGFQMPRAFVCGVTGRQVKLDQIQLSNKPIQHHLAAVRPFIGLGGVW